MLTVPLNIPPRIETPSLPKPAPPKIRIVLVDDHPIFRDSLRRILSLEDDMEIVGEANDGGVACALVHDLAPDIVLLDLKMPNLDGLTTLQRFRDVEGEARVIVLTASEENSQFVQAMRLGAAGIVQKQNATSSLIQSIRDVHSGGIWLDSHMAQVVMTHFRGGSAPVADQPALSQREREMVILIAQGLRNKEIADRMMIAHQTVKNYLHNIYDKLQIASRLELALYATQNQLISRDGWVAPSSPAARETARRRLG